MKHFYEAYKYMFLFCLIIIAAILVGCSNGTDNSSLDNWVGEYKYEQGKEEYFKFVEKYADRLEKVYSASPRVVIHKLSILNGGGGCVGRYFASGWKTYHVMEVGIKGNSEEISIIFHSLTNGYYNGKPLASGDVLFKLKKSGDDIITQWALKPDYEPAFQNISISQSQQSENSAADSNEASATESESDKDTEEEIYSHPYHGTSEDPDQVVRIDLRRYYGVWKVGDPIGCGYGNDGVDPKGEFVGGEVIFEEDKITFNGPKSSETLENPRYVTVLQSGYSFVVERRAYYDSFDFPNAFLIRVDIYDGDDTWKPFSGFWIKDLDTIVHDHHVYHELNKVKD